MKSMFAENNPLLLGELVRFRLSVAHFQPAWKSTKTSTDQQIKTTFFAENSAPLFGEVVLFRLAGRQVPINKQKLN
jgi:hypothetical protein